MIELPCKDLHVVLYQPEIPANTGNIGRLCVGTGAMLHLIKPFRFLLTDRELKRAGLDYWPRLKIVTHDSLDEIFHTFPTRRIFLCTTKTAQSYTERSYREGDVFVFGPETRGLPPELLERYPDQCIGIPMTADIRSHNLANSVAIILYEAIRQIIGDKS
ncbi:MAG TPA: tRNA (cytidine(34)-2'-O)-methyltransferase [Candidatus Cloacimonadota bacterium]|nr:tRNA (cytidine(34)-2'-O)-methyltransferase [Candidatus Cloacimonadota bacterium]